MSEQIPERRPHPRLLLVRAVLVMRSAWIVAGLGVGLNAVLPPAWHTVLVVLVAYYAYTRCVQVFYDYAAIRYSGGPRGIVVTRGLIAREEKRFRWDSVVTVSATQTVLQRLLRIADLRVDLDASEIASETLPGIGVREAARLVRLHSQHGSEPPDRRSTAETACGPGTVAPVAPVAPVTPVLSALDFVLIGIYSGAFVLFVPSVYSVTAEVSRWLGLPVTVLPSLHVLTSGDARTLGVSSMAAVALGVGYGTCVAWIRYRRFAVSLRSSGDLVFVAGLSSREQRVIAADAVAAFELRRPLLMRPARRAVLRAVVRGDSGHITRGMLLPLTGVPAGVAMLSTLTGLSDAVFASRSRRLPMLAASSAVVVTGLGASALSACFSTELALVVGAVAFLLFRAVDVRFGSIRLESSAMGACWIVAERGIFFRSTWAISEEAVDVSRWSGVTARYGSQTVSVRGRRRIRLTVWPTSERLALQLRRAVESSTPLPLERTTR
jgi:uncharacterized membrane protein YdbT with pleckstrin-like domain